MATLLAVVLSLTADALIVFTGTRLFPSTRGYPHFRFADYATLTIIGVVVAAAAWVIVVQVSCRPRRLFIRLAAVVTIVLWAPDLYLLLRQQPVRAVALLMTMHVAVAVVTYNLLVRLAPPPTSISEAMAPVPEGMPEASPLTVTPEAWTQAEAMAGRSISRWAWMLELLVGVEVALGIATLAVVPTGRSSGWLPSRGTAFYVAHAALGLPLALGALAYLAHVRGSSRINLLSGWSGLGGVMAAGIGGLLTVEHPLRLVGMALMLVGAVVAAFGFLLPALDNLADEGDRSDG